MFLLYHTDGNTHGLSFCKSNHNRFTSLDTLHTKTSYPQAFNLNINNFALDCSNIFPSFFAHIVLFIYLTATIILFSLSNMLSY